MSTEQSRRDNTTDGREIKVEVDIVPKMTTHFESLADKVQDLQVEPKLQQSYDKDKQSSETATATATHGEEEMPKGVGKFEMHAEQDKEGSDKAQQTEADKDKISRSSQRKEEEGGGEERDKSSPSLEEISKYRETAQQNSMEAIRAAQERYQKAKEVATEEQESTGQGGGDGDEKEVEYRESKQEFPEEGVPEMERGGTVGVLQAIGETIVEIAQTTKELVAGGSQQKQAGRGSYEK